MKKKLKQNVQQMLPIALIIGLMVIMSLFLYYKVMEREETQCWQLLEESANSVTKEIQVNFNNDLTTLHLVAGMLEREETLSPEAIDAQTLQMFEENTLFSRLDMIYPDDTVLLENGTVKALSYGKTFAEIAQEGETMSPRITDPETGEESVCYFVPIRQQGETVAVLAGVIASSTLKEEFHPSIYNGQASSCIVDSRDGNYVMDEWHDELGNAYTTPDRTKLKAYENISLKEEVKAQRTGVIAFESKTTGKPLYMYYMPLQLFDWELLVFVQEDVAFANLIYLKHLLIFAGIVEALFLAIYFVWNLRQVRQLMKQQEQLQFMSYCDGLTSLYNRNKYIELIESCKNEKRENVGVAYLDLNGLKEINDQKGHANGDRLICAAADILHQVCPGSVYRIGGDEFVIISFGVEEEIFEKQIQMIREQMWTQQISISLGALWRASCDGLERLLKEADVRMYAEKQQYYQMCEQQADGDAGYAEK